MSEFEQSFNQPHSLNIYFSGIIETLKNLGRAEMDTIGIVFSHDQFEAILKSLTEVREGQVVSVKEAFADLSC